jgi:hypothetical protein
MIYRFHPAAEAEHYETIEDYESCNIRLGGEYLLEFERLMSRVVEALRCPLFFAFQGAALMPPSFAVDAC